MNKGSMSIEEEEEYLPLTDRSSREHALDSEDDEKFRRACVSVRKYAARRVFMYGCMAVFGMRVSEMCHLHLDWFDISKPGDECIRIPRQMKCNCYDCMLPRKNKPNAQIGVWKTKSRASARVIPGRYNIEVFWAMYSFAKESKTRLELGETKVDAMPRNRRHVWSAIRDLGRATHTKKTVFPHALRATAATHLSQFPGMTAAQLMRIMGWSQLETANDYIQFAGIEVLKIFRPSDYQLKQEADAMSAIEDTDVPTEIAFPGGNEPKAEAVTCTMCGAKVSLKGDGTWECSACGAVSNL